MDAGEVVGEVEAEERTDGVAALVRVAGDDHLTRQLDVARLWVAAEPDPSEQEPEVGLGEDLARGRSPAGRLRDELAQERGATEVGCAPAST